MISATPPTSARADASASTPAASKRTRFDRPSARTSAATSLRGLAKSPFHWSGSAGQAVQMAFCGAHSAGTEIVLSVTAISMKSTYRWARPSATIPRILPLTSRLKVWRTPMAGRGLNMIFRQLFDSTSSTYTYLLASRHGGEALIIDPVLERVDRYIQLLKELDLRLVKAIDTPLHADHITGLEALSE